ncbi:MAG: carbamoyl-phosphate synthase large subunit [Sphingobacteriales bacterium]|jgi:carbamoyl-phosphate synthase large subunit
MSKSSSIKNKHIIMTGAGAPGAPGILKCLKQDPNLKITLADSNPNAVGKWLHPNFEVIPMASADDFISSLLSLCKKLEITHILPLVTRELFKFSSAKNEFEKAGIQALVSNPEGLNIANDKGLTYLTLQENNIATPDFVIVHTLSDLESAVKELGYPKTPVTIKPCVSNGSRGFRIIESESSSNAASFFNEKPSTTSNTLEEIMQLLNGYDIPPMLVSEYLPGDEYSIDCVVKNGKSIITLPRKRTEIRAGISVRGEFVQNKDIINYCEEIVNVLKLEGNIGLQVKQASDGTFKLLEINPRVQGTIVSALGVGVNLPLLAIEDNTPSAFQIDWGTKFVRYYEEVYYK